MSMTKESFIAELSASGLRELKRTELLEIAGHYKLECSSSLKKDEFASSNPRTLT